MIRCSIWTLPFGKIHFSQLNTASAGIVARCRLFSAWTEEMPEVIALNHILIALNFSAKLCVLTFQIRRAELAANGFVLRKLLLQTASLPELMDRKKRDIMERKGDKEDENKRQKQQKESSAAAL